MNMVIFGLGRIGLPIALVCAESGYNVTGIDINHALIESLNKGQIAFNEPGMKDLLIKHLHKTFYPKHQEENITPAIRQAEYIMLAVGTGFAKYPEKPQLSVLYSIIGQLISMGLKNKTIILRVTLPIGTSEAIIRLIEQKTGLVEGRDFWFAFVPERIMEGKAIQEERSLPKIIGAQNEKAFENAQKLFQKIGGEIVKVSNPRTAEFIKLIDNSWRNTQFAFANELAYLAEENTIDVLEAIQCANQKYKRNQIPKPGPVSGYCLGKDPYLLELNFSSISKKRGFGSVWFTGRRANDWLIDKVIDDVKGKKILIAGLTFKEDIDDFRYSHGIEITKKLIKRGYTVTVTDPYLGDNYYTNLPNDITNKTKSFKKIEDALKHSYDTIILAVRHSQYQKHQIQKLLKETKKNQQSLLLDLWNII